MWHCQPYPRNPGDCEGRELQLFEGMATALPLTLQVVHHRSSQLGASKAQALREADCCLAPDQEGTPVGGRPRHLPWYLCLPPPACALGGGSSYLASRSAPLLAAGSHWEYLI